MTTHRITSQNYGICNLATVEEMPKKYIYYVISHGTSLSHKSPTSKSWANLGVDPLGPKEQNVQNLSFARSVCAVGHDSWPMRWAVK